MLVFYFMLQYTSTTKKAKDDFNFRTMEQNANNLVSDANTCMDTLYGDLVTNNYYGIANNKATGVAPNPYASASIVIDPYGFAANAHTEPELNMVYDTIVAGSKLSSSIKLMVSNQSSLDTLYASLINIITSYDKCNSIFALQGERLPFPIMELSLYLIVIVVSLYVLYIIVVDLELQANYNTRKSIGGYIGDHAKELFDPPATDKTEKLSDDEKKAAKAEQDKLCEKAMNLAVTKPLSSESYRSCYKIGGCAVVITITGLFINMLQQNGDNYMRDMQSNFGSTHDCAP